MGKQSSVPSGPKMVSPEENLKELKQQLLQQRSESDEPAAPPFASAPSDASSPSNATVDTSVDIFPADDFTEEYFTPEENLKNLKDVVVQDGIYHVERYPNHAVTKFFKQTLGDWYFKWAEEARAVFKHRKETYQKSKVEHLGKAASSAFLGMSNRLDEQESNIVAGQQKHQQALIEMTNRMAGLEEKQQQMTNRMAELEESVKALTGLLSSLLTGRQFATSELQQRLGDVQAPTTVSPTAAAEATMDVTVDVTMEDRSSCDPSSESETPSDASNRPESPFADLSIVSRLPSLSFASATVATPVPEPNRNPGPFFDKKMKESFTEFLEEVFFKQLDPYFEPNTDRKGWDPATQTAVSKRKKIYEFICQHSMDVYKSVDKEHLKAAAKDLDEVRCERNLTLTQFNNDLKYDKKRKTVVHRTVAGSQAKKQKTSPSD